MGALNTYLHFLKKDLENIVVREVYLRKFTLEVTWGLNYYYWHTGDLREKLTS